MKIETIAAPIVNLALTEDIGSGDVTTQAVVTPSAKTRAEIIAREAGVIAGLAVVRLTFHSLDPHVVFRTRCRDGERVEPDQVICVIEGTAHAILSGERVALNFLQHLSGIATQTARYVAAIRGTGTEVRDTRKTTPVLRLLEKYAVLAGGGRNHRYGLFDMVLFKENHLQAAGSIAGAVESARTKSPGVPIEVEARTLAEAREAAAADVDWLLLDNMLPEEVREVVEALRGKEAAKPAGGKAGGNTEGAEESGPPPRPAIEASGRINLENARAYAETGIDAISVGAITHSAPALDCSLLFKSVSDMA